MVWDRWFGVGSLEQVVCGRWVGGAGFISVSEGFISGVGTGDLDPAVSSGAGGASGAEGTMSMIATRQHSNLALHKIPEDEQTQVLTWFHSVY